MVLVNFDFIHTNFEFFKKKKIQKLKLKKLRINISKISL